MYYSLHKTKLRRGRSYIKSPKWLKNKRAIINPSNKRDGNCFQYALTLALNHQNIERDDQRISKIKPFINHYNWNDIDFPSYRKDWKKFEQNNKTIALNISFVPLNTKTIRLACKSKYNRKRENQVILLIITNGKKWHYLALKSEPTFDGKKWYNRPIASLPRLLRGITSNHNGDFYCLNYCHSYRTDNKLKKPENICNEHDYCYPEMNAEDNKMLEYNHGEKSPKVPFIIYFDLESLLPKMGSCQKYPGKSYTERKTSTHFQVERGL